MSNFSWWILCNKFANFLMLFAICWYFARKYLFPWAHKTLQDRASHTIALEQKAMALMEQRLAIQQATDAQEAYAAMLLIKIKAWKAAMEEKEREQVVREELLEQRCVAYLQRRADGVCQERLQQDMFPRVYNQTREQVLTFFKNNEEHARYVKKLVEGLPKGKVHG